VVVLSVVDNVRRVEVTSEPSSTVDEEQTFRKSRRRQRSVVLSTPPAVRVHIGSDGPTSNGSISSRGIVAADARDEIFHSEMFRNFVNFL